MSEENNKTKENYWHRERRGSFRKGLSLHHDREVQLREMRQYVCSLDELRRRFTLDTRIIQSALFAGVALGILGIVLFFTLSGDLRWIGALLAVGGPLGAYVLYTMRSVRRRRTLKYSLVHQAVERYFHPEVYLAQKRLQRELIDEASLVDEWVDSEVSDYFAGSWKGVPFQFGDLMLLGKPEGMHQREVLFSGQLFILELNREVPVPIRIREREELLTPEMVEARKASPRFFLTGNMQFDRQFAVSYGEDHRVSGFEDTGENTQEEVRASLHEIIDGMVADILDADTYASSRTSISLVHKRMYLAIENSRDTFELMPEDEKKPDVDLLRKRFEEEAEHITSYLDLVTRSGGLFTPEEKSSEETESKDEASSESGTVGES